MKVIKSGDGRKGWAKEFTCTGSGNGGGGCGAILLVEASDIYLTCTCSYDGSRETFKTFSCPECSVETDVDIPSSIEISGVKPSKSTDNGSK